MEKISYGGTFFFKVVFPGFWFAFLTVFLVVGLLHGVQRQPIFVIQPLLMMIFGYFLFRKLVWDLADEVRDGGGYLLVRKGSVERRVPLTDVMNVSMSQATSPRRLTLRLRTPGDFGDEITFIPRMKTFQLNPFARNAIAENLIRRVDAARLERRT
ncbi:MAG: hypothetical protein HOQ10_14470 [Frateuria sp.]|uniref:hypothetical protein n=1 Tax=Frateuria sp. TaxID=2211372 RepID=UPI0017B3EAD7|nr:hypothetical protein [Frateuria sp.]NUO73903.1 hypothetical protein [Frateuria sp.]NUR22142.1 hypothetical protein [Frateuria sp.]